MDSNSASTNPQMCLHLSKRGVNECVGAMLELHLCAKQIQNFSDSGNLEWKWVQRFPKMLDLQIAGISIIIIYIYIILIYFFFIAGAILSATWPCLWRRCFAFAAAFALALWLSILGRYLGLAQNRKNIGEFVGECGYDKHKKKVWQESNPWELKKLWSDAMKSLWATSCFYLSDQAFSVYSSKLWISQCVTNE